MPKNKYNPWKYRIGRAFEYRCKKHFEKQGYWVMRSSGSHGQADLLAIGRGEILLIQCTTNEKMKSEKEIKALKDLAKSMALPCFAVLATRKGRNIIIKRYPNHYKEFCEKEQLIP